VGLWKRELQKQAYGIFDTRSGRKSVDQSVYPEWLYSEIGRLKWSWIGSLEAVFEIYDSRQVKYISF
jgi:hypothetical protein